MTDRNLIILGHLVALALGGVLGQALYGHLLVALAVFFIGLPALIAFVVRNMTIMRMAVVEVALILTCLMGGFASATEAGKSYTYCIENGEELRGALSVYHRENGYYPSALSDLNMDIPGQRLVFSSLIRYESTEQDYHLSCTGFLWWRAVASDKYRFAVIE